MSRHVDPHDHSFGRSLLRAAAGGVLAMVVTFGITALLTQVGGNDPAAGPAVTQTGDVPSPSPRPTEATQAPSPVPPEPTVEPATEIDGETVTVQVLYAPGLDELAGEVAAVLRDLGYAVAAVNETARTVDTTTILATDGAEDDAAQLREADPRFAQISTNDGFSEAVDLHVLVGPDFAD